jgi:hypothetical protein
LVIYFADHSGKALAYACNKITTSIRLGNISVSHYSGEPWLEFMAGHSLMRPRNLLKLFRFAAGYAINMGYARIEYNDITHAFLTYAQDLIIEVDRELTDIFPRAKGLIREFSEENS